MKNPPFRIFTTRGHGSSVNAIDALIERLVPVIDELPANVILTALATLMAALARAFTKNDEDARRLATASLAAGFGYDGAVKALREIRPRT